MGHGHLPLAIGAGIRQEFARKHQVVVVDHRLGNTYSNYFNSALCKADQEPARNDRPSTTHEGDSKALQG